MKALCQKLIEGELQNMVPNVEASTTMFQLGYQNMEPSNIDKVVDRFYNDLNEADYYENFVSKKEKFI